MLSDAFVGPWISRLVCQRVDFHTVYFSLDDQEVADLTLQSELRDRRRWDPLARLWNFRVRSSDSFHNHVNQRRTYCRREVLCW